MFNYQKEYVLRENTFSKETKKWSAKEIRDLCDYEGLRQIEVYGQFYTHKKKKIERVIKVGRINTSRK